MNKHIPDGASDASFLNTGTTKIPGGVSRIPEQEKYYNLSFANYRNNLCGVVHLGKRNKTVIEILKYFGSIKNDDFLSSLRGFSKTVKPVECVNHYKNLFNGDQDEIYEIYVSRNEGRVFFSFYPGERVVEIISIESKHRETKKIKR